MDVVGGDARITAEQLPAVLAHSAVLHVVVLLLLLSLLPLLFVLLLLFLGLPLYPLLLLGGQRADRDRQKETRRDWKMEAKPRCQCPGCAQKSQGYQTGFPDMPKLLTQGTKG